MTDVMGIETPAVETPADTGWISPTGDFNLESAPENVRTLAEKKKWNNIVQLADGYTELEKFKGGGKHLVIPEVEDSEGWQNVYNQMGRPETPDKYSLSYEGEIPLNDELVSSFKQFAHKEGYTQKQFEGAAKFQLEAIEASEKLYKEQQAEREAQNIQAMKQKWGEEKFGPTLKRVEGTAEKLGVLKYFKDMGIDKEPEIVNMLLTIANSDSEDTLTSGTPPQPAKTPQNELEEIKKNPAFTDKFHQDHKAVMKRFMDVNVQIANSGQSRAPKSR